jgi:3D (Asp-Asp-Asp) domain-containing protein
MILAVSLWVLATAYCDKGRTFTGSLVRKGTIAVDPRRIPLWSSLYVPGYGLGRALDTGRAIKGNRIDVWFSSCRQAILWGRKRVFVKIGK